MNQFCLAPSIQAIADKGRITSEDVLHLRRTLYADGTIDASDAEALFWLNECCPHGPEEWNEFFAEALADRFVNQAEPAGYITEAQGETIASLVLRDGRIDTASELRMLLRIIETASEVPKKLILFVIGEVRASVLSGKGALRGSGNLASGVIAEAEVEMLEKLVYGIGSEGNMVVSRLEAELLFDLNDAVVDAENHEAWAEFFVKAIANHLLSAPLWQMPSRDVMEAREAWLNDRDGALGFMSKMATSSLAGVFGSLADEESDRTAELEEIVSDAEMVTEEEAHWLAERISRDGTLHENERALLEHLEREASTIHPRLKALLERAA